MRLIEVVLAGLLLGATVAFMQMANASTASASATGRGADEPRYAVSERITWLRLPALMRRTSPFK
jgi:tetrahydromethanopterin S-methyltransferase subunit D